MQVFLWSLSGAPASLKFITPYNPWDWSRLLQRSVPNKWAFLMNLLKLFYNRSSRGHKVEMNVRGNCVELMNISNKTRFCQLNNPKYNRNARLRMTCKGSPYWGHILDLEKHLGNLSFCTMSCLSWSQWKVFSTCSVGFVAARHTVIWDEYAACMYRLIQSVTQILDSYMCIFMRMAALRRPVLLMMWRNTLALHLALWCEEPQGMTWGHLW